MKLMSTGRSGRGSARRGQKIARFGAAVAITAGALVVGVGAPQAATAAPNCYISYYGTAPGYMECFPGGSGQAQGWIACTAIWPLTSWARTTAWVTPHPTQYTYGYTNAPDCPWPASYTKGVRYR